MLRVRKPSGEPASRVIIDGVYEPSGRVVRETRPTPQGLCIFHWLANGKDERLVLELRCPDGRSARVEVRHDRPAPAEVIEVQLSEAG